MSQYNNGFAEKIFDPHNIRHVEAYQELQKTGIWPEKFWNEVISPAADQGFPLERMWDMIIRARMADAWIASVLNRKKGYRWFVIDSEEQLECQECGVCHSPLKVAHVVAECPTCGWTDDQQAEFEERMAR